MKVLFQALDPVMPNVVLETIDFIEEDESTTVEDLVLYFQRLIEATVPEEVKKMEVYKDTLLYVCVENVSWHSNAKTRKEFLIKCYREAILFANILAMKNQLSSVNKA